MAGKKDNITVIAVPTMLITLSMGWVDGNSKAYHLHFSHFARGEGCMPFPREGHRKEYLHVTQAATSIQFSIISYYLLLQ